MIDWDRFQEGNLAVILADKYKEEEDPQQNFILNILPLESIEIFSLGKCACSS